MERDVVTINGDPYIPVGIVRRYLEAQSILEDAREFCNMAVEQSQNASGARLPDHELLELMESVREIFGRVRSFMPNEGRFTPEAADGLCRDLAERVDLAWSFLRTAQEARVSLARAEAAFAEAKEELMELVDRGSDGKPEGGPDEWPRYTRGSENS